MRLPTERFRELRTRLAELPGRLGQSAARLGPLLRGGKLPKWVIPTVGTLSLLAVLVPGLYRRQDPRGLGPNCVIVVQ